MSRRRARLETSAGGVVIRRDQGTALFLLIRDSYDHWGFPKGHVEPGERAEDAALREVAEETGLPDLRLVGAIHSIDWYFRLHGRLIHKVCHFFLMECDCADTNPQADEGITACRWEPFDAARGLVAYDNAREVLEHARALADDVRAA